MSPAARYGSGAGDVIATAGWTARHRTASKRELRYREMGHLHTGVGASLSCYDWLLLIIAFRSPTLPVAVFSDLPLSINWLRRAYRSTFGSHAFATVTPTVSNSPPEPHAPLFAQSSCWARPVSTWPEKFSCSAVASLLIGGFVKLIVLYQFTFTYFTDRRWLQLRFAFGSTAVRLRFDDCEPTAAQLAMTAVAAATTDNSFVHPLFLKQPYTPKIQRCHRQVDVINLWVCAARKSCRAESKSNHCSCNHCVTYSLCRCSSWRSQQVGARRLSGAVDRVQVRRVGGELGRRGNSVSSGATVSDSARAASPQSA